MTEQSQDTLTKIMNNKEVPPPVGLFLCRALKVWRSFTFDEARNALADVAISTRNSSERSKALKLRGELVRQAA